MAVFFSLKCFDLSSEASSDFEEVAVNVDEVLKEAELNICKELKTDLTVGSKHFCMFYTSLISVSGFT